MRKLLACLAAAATLGALVASAATAAQGGGLTVRAVGQSQTTVDANRNGAFDRGDYMVISAQLTTLSGLPAGWFQARVSPTSSAQASVYAQFVFGGTGALVVGGTFAFESGPPKGLRVTSAYGGLRSLSGAVLTIADESDGTSIFTFSR
jgi:hypothetical protein